MRHPRLRLMARGILLTIIGWALLVFFALWHGATWPVGFSAWHAFVVVIVAIEFLTLKSWLMGRRAWTRDRLTYALVAANSVFALNFLWFFVALNLWPELGAWRWAHLITIGLLDLLVLALLWGLLEFWRIPDPPDEC